MVVKVHLGKPPRFDHHAFSRALSTARESTERAGCARRCAGAQLDLSTDPGHCCAWNTERSETAFSTIVDTSPLREGSAAGYELCKANNAECTLTCKWLIVEKSSPCGHGLHKCLDTRLCNGAQQIDDTLLVMP